MGTKRRRTVKRYKGFKIVPYFSLYRITGDGPPRPVGIGLIGLFLSIAGAKRAINKAITEKE